MMEEEVVRRRKWLTSEEFLDLLGATNFIPGPNSSELAIHIGHRRAGWPGLIVAGICFILPATLIVTAIAWAYLRFGKLPEAAALLYGVKPVILAIMVHALWSLGKTAVKTKFLAVMGLSAAAACFAGMSELLVLFVCGALMVFLAAGKISDWKRTSGVAPFLASLPKTSSTATAATAAGVAIAVPFSSNLLFWFFLKVGAVLFGSGYVLLAFIRADLVERWHWLTETQLLDAIAVGQFTPGPVFTTATFIGYILGGPGSALLATVGIFLPAFVFVALSAPFIPRLRVSPLAGAFLDGVNVASLALMAFVTFQLGATALVDWFTGITMVVTAGLLIRYRTNSAWLVLGGAILGLINSLW